MSLETQQRDYLRIANAIAYLRRHYRQQPTLAEIAASSDLSEAHFQRLFSRWAGISPKRFVQFLTVEYAKRQMSEQQDLFGLSLDAGLSGPGRLHDLFVNMEAMSPGEYKWHAAGLTLGWAIVPTPFGSALLAFSQRGICHLSFLASPAHAEDTLRAQWPGARLQQQQGPGMALAQEIFVATRHDQPVATWVVGTNFQVQVWRALLAIPSGGLRSYQQVAAELGRPRAARSVGSAIARNPIGYLVPCHRVLRRSGEIGAYHWGSERKAAMVAWEAAHRQAEGEMG